MQKAYIHLKTRRNTNSTQTYECRLELIKRDTYSNSEVTLETSNHPVGTWSAGDFFTLCEDFQGDTLKNWYQRNQTKVTLDINPLGTAEANLLKATFLVYQWTEPELFNYLDFDPSDLLSHSIIIDYDAIQDSQSFLYFPPSHLTNPVDKPTEDLFSRLVLCKAEITVEEGFSLKRTFTPLQIRSIRLTDLNPETDKLWRRIKNSMRKKIRSLDE